MTGGLRVTADRDLCVGAGNCVWRLPQVFAQREDDGLVRLVSTTPDPSLRDQVGEVVADCPSQAIGIEGW